MLGGVHSSAFQVGASIDLLLARRTSKVVRLARVNIALLIATAGQTPDEERYGKKREIKREHFGTSSLDLSWFEGLRPILVV